MIVANEYWNNGLTAAELQDYGNYLATNTDLLVALSSPGGNDCTYVNEPEKCIVGLYPNNGLIDIATIHFARVPGTWNSVWNCTDAYFYIDPDYVKISHNEPIGPRYGDDYSTYENDPVHIVMAAAFAWHAKLPMYVFHSTPGVKNPNNVSFRKFFGKPDDTYIPDTVFKDVFPALKNIILSNNGSNLPNWSQRPTIASPALLLQLPAVLYGVPAVEIIQLQFRAVGGEQ